MVDLPLCACPTTATLRISLPWYVFICFSYLGADLWCASRFSTAADEVAPRPGGLPFFRQKQGERMVHGEFVVGRLSKRRSFDFAQDDRWCEWDLGGGGAGRPWGRRLGRPDGRFVRPRLPVCRLPRPCGGSPAGAWQMKGR